MSGVRVQFYLTVDQKAKLRRSASIEGRSVSAVVRAAIDSYVAPVDEVRREAAEAITSMNLPVDDWEVMQAQIMRSQSGDW